MICFVGFRLEVFVDVLAVVDLVVGCLDQLHGEAVGGLGLAYD